MMHDRPRDSEGGPPSEVAQLRRERDVAIAALARERTAHEQFISKLAHELRNELTVIVGLADVLERGHRSMDPEASGAAVVAIARQANRSHELLEELMAVTTSSGERRAIDLESTVAQVVASMSLSSSVRVKCAGTVRVRVDARDIRLIVRNLLRNAAAHGSPPITVEIGDAGGMAELRVSDEGPGIRAAFVDQLFEPFRRDDPDRSRSGAGLGLSIVRQIVEREGGEVRYEPNKERGAVFIVRLPLTADA